MLPGMAARLLGLFCLILALAGCGSAPREAQVVAATPAPSKISAVAPSASLAVVEIRVYVTGAVARPGVYGLTPDSRVEDAIAAAGGFLAGADTPRVNLAARLRDEQEIFVPKVGESVPNLPSGAVNVNSASAAQLREGLGISSTLASRIVAYRRQHGPFKTVDDLRLVPVPDDQLTRIRSQVTTG
jgi:competence protein ComEA